MAGGNERYGGGGGAGYLNEKPAAGAPGGYGAPPRKAPGAQPGYRTPPGYAQPQQQYAQPQQQYAQTQQQHAQTQQQYAQTQQQHAQTQQQYAQPQQQYAQQRPQNAPGGYKTHLQQPQRPPPKVVQGVPLQPMGHGYQPQQPVGVPPNQQPVGVPPNQQPGGMVPPGQWTTGLFDMGEDPSNCVMTFFLPCITFGQIVEVIDQGTTSCLMGSSVWVAALLCFGAPCFISCLWRTKLRAKYNLPQDEIGDLCIHFWCEPCALCQEYRELNNRGLNPSLGWEHHRQQLSAQLTPPQMGAPQQAYMRR